MVIEILLDTGCNVALEVLLCRMLAVRLEPEILDSFLACRASLPCFLRTLVTIDVDILLREELHNLIKNVLDELECGFLSWAKNLVCDTPYRSYRVRTTGTAKFRI